MENPFAEENWEALERAEQYSKAKVMYDLGQYKELIDYVDDVYGWEPGELAHPYDETTAYFCMKQPELH